MRFLKVLSALCQCLNKHSYPLTGLQHDPVGPTFHSLFENQFELHPSGKILFLFKAPLIGHNWQIFFVHLFSAWCQALTVYCWKSPQLQWFLDQNVCIDNSSWGGSNLGQNQYGMWEWGAGGVHNVALRTSSPDTVFWNTVNETTKKNNRFQAPVMRQQELREKVFQD